MLNEGELLPKYILKSAQLPKTNSLSSRDFSLISCHKDSAVNSASCLLINTVFGQNIAHYLGKKEGSRWGRERG